MPGKSVASYLILLKYWIALQTTMRIFIYYF